MTGPVVGCEDGQVRGSRGILNRVGGNGQPGVAERLDALSAQIERLAATVEEIVAEQRRLSDWQAETRTRARRTQALTARTYETLQGWPERLERARAAESYEIAYEEPSPLISIPIPTYHSPQTLCERALASVQAQTHTQWEAIVVGDHCTYDTAERVAALGDERISFINLPARETDPRDPWERWAVKGSVPRAAGIGLARGRWIAPLSHDDAWDPEHLQRLLGLARSSRAEVVYSRMRVTRSDGAPVSALAERSIGAFPPRYGQFGWQSAMFHSHLDFLRYDRNCAFASEPNDWNLARRAWEAGVRFAYLPEETVTLFAADRLSEIVAELAADGLPPSAAAPPA